jgi:hypothetical protein
LSGEVELQRQTEKADQNRAFFFLWFHKTTPAGTDIFAKYHKHPTYINLDYFKTIQRKAGSPKLPAWTGLGGRASRTSVVVLIESINISLLALTHLSSPA